MHGRRKLRDFCHTIKDLTVGRNMLLKDFSHVYHALCLARHAQVRVQSSVKGVQEASSALKTRGGVSQCFVLKSAPRTLTCPVILCQV